MRQWFGVSANAALNTRWTKFINHVNYKIIDSNMMDWANVTKIRTPPSAKRYFSPPPWRACAVQRQFRDRARNAFSPPVTALLLVLTKRSAAPGHRMPEEILGMHKVIADIGQRAGNVIIIPVSWALNINAWDANCLLAINAQYIWKTEDVEELKAGKSVAYNEAYDRDLKRAASGLLKRRVSAFR